MLLPVVADPLVTGASVAAAVGATELAGALVGTPVLAAGVAADVAPIAVVVVVAGAVTFPHPASVKMSNTARAHR